jgi:lipopolysaccharide heptosyltransferase II
MNIEIPSLKNILIIRLDNLGDLVMLTPALRALSIKFPKAYLSLLCSHHGSRIAPLLTDFKDIITQEALWQDAFGTLNFDPNRELELIKNLRSKNYDGVFIFTSFSQNSAAAAYACYLAGIEVRVGFESTFSGAVLTHAIPSETSPLHQVERNCYLLERCNIPVSSTRLSLKIPSSAHHSSHKKLLHLGLGFEYVVIAPGASCSARRFSIERYVKVAELIAERLRIQVLFLGDNSDKELLENSRFISSANRRIHSLCGETSVAEFAALISNSILFIGNNSGGLHIAEALSVPMVIMFAGTDLVEAFGPRFTPSQILTCPVTCSPCFKFDCPFNHECLNIPLDRIVNQVEELISSKKHSTYHFQPTGTE